MTLQNDEKTCPFCFEVIKRQALRCKHCQADLSGGAPAGASYETRADRQGFAFGGSGNTFKDIQITTTLSELDAVDPGKKRQLLAAYESLVRDFPEAAQYHFALGLSYLDLRLYDLALASLRSALGKGAREASLYYYLALATIEGKRPRVLSFAKVKEIESYLEAAIRLESDNAQALVLWAIVKHDYYVSNGLKVLPPGVEELLASAARCRISQQELGLLPKHMTVPPAFAEMLRA